MAGNREHRQLQKQAWNADGQDQISIVKPAEGSAPAPRPAATVVIVRDSVPRGVEVLLLRRGDANDHNSGAWVFPGGVVDPTDRLAHKFCAGLDDVSASRRLGLPTGGLDYYVASIRECFEEAGLLLATSRPRERSSWRLPATSALSDWRSRLRSGASEFQDLCRSEALMLLADRLRYISHWITPVGIPKRYDTRFFVAPLPPNQQVLHDGEELVAHRWISPAAALDGSADLRLLNATRSVLESIASFDSVARVLAWAQDLTEIPVVLPRLALGRSGRRALFPHEEAWAEVGRLDPKGRCTASYDINPESAVRLSERITRVTAHPTDPALYGRNTYVVGGEPGRDCAVIDPASPDPLHLDAVLAAAAGPLRRIFLTDDHPDNVAAAVLLKSRANAMIVGASTGGEVRTGQCVTVNEQARLRCIATHGQGSMHRCYVLEQESTLLACEHILALSPGARAMPDASLGAHLIFLWALRREQLAWLAPSRGFLIADPQRMIAASVDQLAQT